MTDTQKPLLVIDMVTDPLCPWCYVGKRALDRAVMALSFSHEVALRYRPYMLNPDTPKGGLDRQLYLDQKFKDKDRLKQMNEGLMQAAQEAALALDTSIPSRVPYTMDALRVLRWAHYEKLHTEYCEALFASYWQDGLDLGVHEVLAALAGKVGMDEKAIAARLLTDEDIEDIKEEVQSFRKGGVNGVPTFIVNEAQGFAGALPPDQLLTALRQLASETPALVAE